MAVLKLIRAVLMTLAAVWSGFAVVGGLTGAIHIWQSRGELILWLIAIAILAGDYYLFRRIRRARPRSQ